MVSATFDLRIGRIMSEMPLSAARHRRLDQGLTLLAMFRKTRIQPSRLSLIERDLIAPRADERERIARALEADQQTLFPDQASADGAGDGA